MNFAPKRPIPFKIQKMIFDTSSLKAGSLIHPCPLVEKLQGVLQNFEDLCIIKIMNLNECFDGKIFKIL